jgi:hypothetical protein
VVFVASFRGFKVFECTEKGEVARMRDGTPKQRSCQKLINSYFTARYIHISLNGLQKWALLNSYHLKVDYDHQILVRYDQQGYY